MMNATAAQATGTTATTSGLQRLLWAGWALTAVLGLLGVGLRLTQGHLPTGYGSYVPWGLWIALYFHGVGISGGAFVLGAGGYVAGLPGFRSAAALRTTILLSLAALVPAFLGVGLDLGHMERAASIFLRPRFTSMMAFNAWMYGAFTILALVALRLSFRERSGWLKPVLVLGVVLSVLFPSQSGAFFGVVGAKPFWNSALLPMVFLASAITAGAATLLVVRALLAAASPGATDGRAEEEAATRTLRLVVMVGLAVYFGFEFAEFSLALWAPGHGSEAIGLVLTGPYWWVFWGVHLLAGGLVPFALLWTRGPRAVVIGAALVAVCFLAARLNVLVPGQAVAELDGLQAAFSHPRLRYVYDATAMEYLVGLFLVAVGGLVFVAGRRVIALYAASAAEGGR